MGKRLVLVGAGHAHLEPLRRLREVVDRGHEVTLINPSPHHYYSGMGPGMLGGMYRGRHARFPVAGLARRHGARFVQDAVVRVEPDRRRLVLASGRTVCYDVVSFNVGSRVPLPGSRGPREHVFPVKPLENLLQARASLRSGLKGGQRVPVLVVGGGPAGVEVAANCWRLGRGAAGRAEITLVSRSPLLAGFPDRARRLARESLRAKGVRVQEGAGVEGLRDGRAVLSNGREIGYAVALVATGVRPPELFRTSGLPVGDDGALLVRATLRCAAHEEVFGAGDCIAIESEDLARVGFHAVKQAPVLFRNLLAALEGGRIEPYRPRRSYVLIFNMGDGTAIGCRWGRAWNGPLTFLLKDFIDRRFVRRYRGG